MSDYLTRLGARALGVANLVRPALAPAFASARSVLPSMDERLRDGPDAAREPDAQEEPLFKPPGRPPRRHPPKSKLSSGTDGQTASYRDASTPSKLGLADTSLETDEVRVSSPQLHVDAIPRSSTGDFQRDRKEEAVASLQVESAVRRATEEPVAAATHTPTAVRSGTQTAIPVLAQHFEDEDSSTPPAPADLPDGSDFEHPQRRAVATRAARQHDAEQQPAFDPSMRRQFASLRALGEIARAQPIAGTRDSAPPIVRVSIGRIEVRAAPARAPAAPRAPARPSVTLARYLARKRGEPT